MITGEEFIQSKGIYHHPRIENYDNNDSFDVADLLEEFAEYHHQEKMKEHDALVKMMAQDEKDGNYKEKGNTPCLHCDGWGYIVDEKGRRKEHCLHCY